LCLSWFLIGLMEGVNLIAKLIFLIGEAFV
jgi:hypothetical protein